MKKFFCIQFAIIFFSIISGVCTRNLIPDHGIVCENVDIIPFNSILIFSDVSMKDMYDDVQTHISDMQNEAIANNYNYTVATIIPTRIRLVSNGNVLISCQVSSVLDGNSGLESQLINVFLPYSESFYYQTDSNMEDFIKSFPEEISTNQSNLIEVARSVSCFCFSKKNVPLSNHKYLAFLKSCQLSDSSQEYFFFMDYYDLTSSSSVPVVEGRLGQYKDYSDNEVFFSSQDDIDMYYSMKEEVISTFFSE